MIRNTSQYQLQRAIHDHPAPVTTKIPVLRGCKCILFRLFFNANTNLDRTRPLQSQPQISDIDIEPTEHHALFADALLRLSGNHTAKDQQDREAFRLATTSRLGEMGHHRAFQRLVPTRGTDLSGEGNGEDNGSDDSDEKVTVVQKKRKHC